MGFILIIVGLIIFVTAIKGTTGKLGGMVSDDIFGANGFVWWLVVILIVGGVGYVSELKQLSRWFLVLLILVLFLANRGVFAQFTSAIKQIQSDRATASTAPTTSTPTTGGLLG